ncbi:MAG: UDP-glucose/GDP-mannose dehydrogenase family protein [Oligoflexales bacterium]
MKLAIVGTGYVGLVSGTCFAEIGHHVTCVDLDEEKVMGLIDGKSPIYEPGLEDMIKSNILSSRLHFTTSLESALVSAETVFIAVGTPPGENGSADIHAVEAVARDIAKHMTQELLVIVKSTVPVGTCDRVEDLMSQELKERGVSIPFQVASNPEFLKEGQAIQDFMRPERVVVGYEHALAAPKLREIYEPLIKDDPFRLVQTNRKSSEMAKYASNAMLATRISFMNELSRLASKVGADMDDIRVAMGSDSRIGRKFLYAGPGYGGSCFPKDVLALANTAKTYDTPMLVLDAVMEANDAQKRWVANIVLDTYKGNMSGLTIAVWGLAFKPGTDDVRETPAHHMVKTILAAGGRIKAHDPEGVENFKKLLGSSTGIEYVKSPYEATQNADGLVLMTEWNLYKQLDWTNLAATMKHKKIFDFRNQYCLKDAKEHGFYYKCIGREESRTS